MENTVIKLENVSKVYKIFDKPSDRLKESLHPFGKRYSRDFYALKKISLTIKKGETVGFIGKNGAGKSTLLKILTGVLTPTGGKIEIKGRVAALLELGAGFNPDMTGLENIYLSGMIMGYTREEIGKKLPEITEFADIGDFINQPVKMYSSGMFARLAFAVNINVEPDILIVDEALSVGDMAFQNKCYKKFNEFRKNGKTVLFVTHDIGLVLNFCNSAVFLENGQVKFFGTAKAAVDEYKKSIVKIERQEEEEEAESGKENEATVWKEHMRLNREMLEYGDKAIEITDYGIFDEEDKLSFVVESDEKIKIKFRIKANREEEEPIFAISIKDIKGTELIGTNTVAEKMLTGRFKEKETAEIEFRQALNLQTGDYTVSFGCVKYEGDNLRIYHRLYDCMFIKVVAAGNSFCGIFDAHTKIEIKR